jgi:localization factor PodJL
MAKTAQVEQKERAHSWERSTTRTTILNAARRVVEREGVFEVSLTSVAREANFAPTTVYAYFTNKSDLLQAVVADDLTSIARAMRDASGKKADNQPAPQTAPAAPQTEPVAETAFLPPPVPRQQRLLIADNRREPEPTKMPEPAAIAIDPIAQLQETVAKLETRPVDAWLERRLREFERALAALEERTNKKAGREEVFSDDVAQEGIRELRQRLDQIEERQRALIEGKFRDCVARIDVSEKRVVQSVSDAQVELAQASRRLTALENAAFAASPEFFQRIPARPSLQIPEPEEQSALKSAADENESAVEEKQDVEAAVEPGTDSYLTAARRSAQAASERMVQGADEAKPRPRSRRKTKITVHSMIALGGSFVFASMLIGAGVFLHAHATPDEAPVAAIPVRVVAPVEKISVRRAAANPVAAAPSHLVTLANAGNAKAELLVALEYLEGNGVARDETLAAQWLMRAAAHGEPVAQYRLGTLYQDGRGLRADPVAAFNWYEAAALQGNRKAMHSLAVAYAEGWGTPKNFNEAARWFERAADFGFTNSQFNLGVLYERGMGVRQSLPDAYKWYSIAAAQGDQESRARVAALKTQMNAADIAAAEQDAASFTPEALDQAVNFTPKLSELPSG